jgi:hypothetical protein
MTHLVFTSRTTTEAGFEIAWLSGTAMTSGVTRSLPPRLRLAKKTRRQLVDPGAADPWASAVDGRRSPHSWIFARKDPREDPGILSERISLSVNTSRRCVACNAPTLEYTLTPLNATVPAAPYTLAVTRCNLLCPSRFLTGQSPPFSHRAVLHPEQTICRGCIREFLVLRIALDVAIPARVFYITATDKIANRLGELEAQNLPPNPVTLTASLHVGILNRPANKIQIEWLRRPRTIRQPLLWVCQPRALLRCQQRRNPTGGTRWAATLRKWP